MKRRPFLAAGLVLAIAVPLVAAGPASAGAGGFQCVGNETNAPDGKIRLGDLPFRGAGFYPATFQGAGVAVGESAEFTLRWRNVSPSNRTVRVQLADEVRDPGYGVRYAVDGVDVTSRVKQGKSLVFRDLEADRQTPALMVVIKNKSGALNSTVSVSISGRYGGTAPETCDLLGPDANLP